MKDHKASEVVTEASIIIMGGERAYSLLQNV
jgi:hypothetical protein